MLLLLTDVQTRVFTTIDNDVADTKCLHIGDNDDAVGKDGGTNDSSNAENIDTTAGNVEFKVSALPTGKPAASTYTAPMEPSMKEVVEAVPLSPPEVIDSIESKLYMDSIATELEVVKDTGCAFGHAGDTDSLKRSRALNGGRSNPGCAHQPAHRVVLPSPLRLLCMSLTLLLKQELLGHWLSLRTHRRH